jgi:hypothetical protein
MEPPRQTAPPSDADGARLVRWATAAVLAVFAVYLARNYSLRLMSDPGLWYLCGKDFAESYWHAKRAYGFPLLVHLAIAVAGPWNALLVNLPVLVAMAAALLALMRRSFAGALPRPELAAALGLAMFLVVERGMLVALVNPFRDPLSYLLMLGAMLALVRYRRGAPPRLAWIAASGALLALAASARETAVLMMGPMFLYALAAKRGDRARPFWIPMLVFLAAFAVAILPLAVQNAAITGNPLVPAQSAKSVSFRGSLVPGVALAHLAHTLPQALQWLGRHYGPAGVVLIVLGAASVIRKPDRGGEVAWLFLPAIAVHLLFYGAYVRPVERYLCVVDLFAIPLAAYGLGQLLRAAGGLLGAAAWPGFLRRGLAAVALLAPALVLLPFLGGPPERFRARDARAFAAWLEGAAPAGALVLGDRPMGEIARALVDRECRVTHFLTPQISVRDPATGPALDGLHRQFPAVYLLYAGNVGHFVAAREFDAAPVETVDAARFRLATTLGKESFHLARLEPWTATASVARVRCDGAGPQVLLVNAGRLSKHPRTWTEVSVDGRVVGRMNRDHDAYFLVEPPSGGREVEVRLASDGPVPREFTAWMRPVSRPLTLSFRGDGGADYTSRLSPEFLTRLRSSMDVFIAARGTVLAPTYAPAPDAVYEVVLALRVSPRPDAPPCRLRVRVGGVVRFDEAWPADGEGRQVKLALSAAEVTGPDTPLDLEFEGPSTLLLRSISVLRRTAR